MDFIKVKNVSFSYAGQTALEDVSFTVNRGEFIGILGPNGGGKSTLLKLLLGIIRPDSGSIFLNEKPLTYLPAGVIGYVPQKTVSMGVDFPATVKEVLETGFVGKNNFMDAQEVSRVLKLAGIENLLDKLLGDLSGGERQKVYIIRSLLAKPEILILDEPTTATDVIFATNFYEFIKELKQMYNLTVLLVSHDIGVVSREVDKIFFLNKTISCFHTTADFMNPENLQEIYGHNLKMILHNH